MSDVLTAPEQDAIAESLLGDPTPDQQGSQEHGAEELSQDQGEIEQQQVDAEGQEPYDQEAADYTLPSEQEKVFPDDVLRQYAEQRYPEVLRLLDSDPTGQIKQLLHDKLNTDIYLRSQQQAQEFDQQELEDAAEQQEPTQQPQAQPQITREQWFANLDRVIAERTDPEVAKAFHSDFLRAFGVPEAAISAVPPQQAQQFTAVASKYMLNLVTTYLPEMLQAQLGNQIGQLFPGFSDMYYRASRADAWDKVRNSDARYSTLPAYGTKEWKDLGDRLGRENPALVELGYRLWDAQGKLHGPNAEKLYGMMAKLAIGGGGVSQELLNQAAQAGARNARRADVRRASANLGSGQSRSASQRQASSRFQTNSDLFDEEAMDRYSQEHGRL